MNPLLPLAYLVAGAIRESGVVLYYRELMRGRRYLVSGLAGAIEAYDLAVLATIIRADWDLMLAAAYVVGVIIGTAAGFGRGAR